MKIESRVLIISLIFIAVLYTVFRMGWGGFFAASFLAGALTSVFDIYALSRMARAMALTGAGWLFVPLGVFRLGLVGFIIFAAFYFYKADPFALLIGAALPFAGVFLAVISNMIRGKKDGASS